MEEPAALLTQTAFRCLQLLITSPASPLRKNLSYNYISVGTPENFPQYEKIILVWFRI